jgi:Ca2+-binding RTX toxin-like protein
MAAVNVTSAYRVEAGQTVTFTAETIFSIQYPTNAPPPSLLIAGSVRGTPVSGSSGYVEGVRISSVINVAPAVRIEATGVLHVEGRSAYGIVRASGTEGPIPSNEGVIRVVGEQYAEGLDDGWKFENRGLFDVQSAGGARGLEVGQGLLNSGTITVFGATSAIAVIISGNIGAYFTNTGRIVAQDNSANSQSIGVQWSSNALWQNDGWIEGDYALRAATPSSFSPQTPNQFINKGTLVGHVDLTTRFARLVNEGAIRGEVRLGTGADTYSGSLGSVSELVSGGDGADSLGGGVQFDYLHGNMGDDTVSGRNGDDWVVGGRDNDVLFGDDGADLVYGNLGDDTCDGGAGDDIVRGGQQNDFLTGGAGNDFMSGDRDADTIAGGSGADTVHTHGAAGLDRVLDFNAAEGDRVFLLAGTQYTVSQVGADTVINMVGGGQMVLVGVSMSTLPAGWIFGA